MRTYEALFIVSPELGDDDIQTIADKVEKLVTDHEGTVVRSEVWGKRKLAYPVKKHTEGSYVLVRFTASPEFIDRLENFFKLADPVIRFLVKYFDKHMLRMEAEQIRMTKEGFRPSAEAAANARREDSNASREPQNSDVAKPAEVVEPVAPTSVATVMGHETEASE